MRGVTLITFPPSLDCELSRFLLGYYGIEHEEHPHALIFSSFVTLWHGRTVAFPLLYSNAFRLGTVRDIVNYFDRLSAGDRKLVLEGPGGQQVEADWTSFYKTLSFATAIFAYYHLLPHKKIMVHPLSAGAPEFEVRGVAAAYPIFAWLLRLLLFLTASRAETALAQTRASLATVDQRLSDGRRYLVGDRLSLSDIAFAVALAPLVLPEGYAKALPSFDEMPPALRAVIAETRSRPSGQFVQSIYRNYRGRTP